MEKITVNGGRPLSGDIRVSGSKNAALPIIFATLITRGVSKLCRVPDITDTRVALEIIESLGALVMREGDTIYVDTRSLYYNIPKASLVSKIRASTYLLGSMLSAFGRCPVMNFGGCNFADRPIDLHIYALERFGAKVDDNTITLDKPHSAKIEFKKASVGATANALISASSINGVTEIFGHAVEPHIINLIDFLTSAGAEITLSDECITVKGGALHGGNVEIIGDMIEAGSYLAAGLVTGGCVSVSGCPVDQMTAFVDFLRSSGAAVTVDKDKISCKRGECSKYTYVYAEPYPAFPTDLQPISAPILAKGSGGIIYDRVFPERFGYLKELSHFGVEYKEGRGFAEILPSKIHKSVCIAPDLRGGMACLLCALTGEGESTVYSSELLLRGYENLDGKLRQIGANIIFN